MPDMDFSQIIVLSEGGRDNNLKYLHKRLASNIACSGGNLHGGKPEKGG